MINDYHTVCAGKPPRTLLHHMGEKVARLSAVGAAVDEGAIGVLAATSAIIRALDAGSANARGIAVVAAKSDG